MVQVKFNSDVYVQKLNLTWPRFNEVLHRGDAEMAEAQGQQRVRLTRPCPFSALAV